MNTVHCSLCRSRELPLPLFHCNICDVGDFDLCWSCFGKGAHCYDASHLMVEVIEKGSLMMAGKYYSSVKSSGKRDVHDIWIQFISHMLGIEPGGQFMARLWGAGACRGYWQWHVIHLTYVYIMNRRFIRQKANTACKEEDGHEWRLPMKWGEEETWMWMW